MSKQLLAYLLSFLVRTCFILYHWTLFDRPSLFFYPDCCEETPGNRFVRQRLDLCAVCVKKGSFCSVLTATNVILDKLHKFQFKEKLCSYLIRQIQPTKLISVLLWTPFSSNLRMLNQNWAVKDKCSKYWTQSTFTTQNNECVFQFHYQSFSQCLVFYLSKIVFVLNPVQLC